MTPEQKKLLRRQVEISAVFKNLFESVDGQAALEYLKYRFFINRSTLDEGPVDSERLLFNEGCRAVVLHIQGLIDLDLEESHRILDQPDPGDLEDELAT